MVSAYDEFTFGAWGKRPDFYVEALKEWPAAREIVINIPDSVVEDLFKVPTVRGEVEDA